MFNNRGQEGAPFELLVAVIIMGFVIFAGMNAMHSVWLQQCKGSTDSKIKSFVNILETTVSQKSPMTVNFRLSGCFNEREEGVRIIDIDDPSSCGSYCGTPKPLCTIVQYLNTGNDSFGYRTCLNIPPGTLFPSQKYVGGRCKNREGHVLENIRENITQGTYLFVNETRVTDSFPTICAYRKLERLEE